MAITIPEIYKQSNPQVTEEMKPKYFKEIVLLLRMIKSRKSIADLRKNGLMYFQIAELLSFSMDMGYTFYTENNDLAVSESGLEYLVESEGFDRRSSGRWIEPLYKFRIQQQSAEAVYIPGRDVIANL